MPPAIQQIIEKVDRAEVQRVVDDLRKQLQACEELLAALGRFEMDANGRIVVNGGERVPATRKREAVLAIMRERPGPWSIRELRDALSDAGIDPDAGTPVKKILWNFAKEGHINANGNGVYELSVLAGSAGGHDREEALAA
jgi:hypothetical protein